MEKFVSYSNDVETIQEAWMFVMDHVDVFSRPSVAITPYSVYESLEEMDGDGETRFAVSVSGTEET